MTAPTVDGPAMHVAFDACAAEEGSVAIVLVNIVRGWQQCAGADRLTVLRPRGLSLDLPAGVGEVVLEAPSAGPLQGAFERTIGIRQACRRLGPDALLSAATASALLGASCPRAVILHDLRHEVLPEQFSARRRLLRRALYAWSLRSTDRIVCVSQRTRGDLLARRPRLAAKCVVAPLGGDHVDGWPATERIGRRYALAFGHFANKNAAQVIAAWAELCRSIDDIDLCLVGMSDTDRADAAAQVAALRIGDRVVLEPWLDGVAFRKRFTGAAVIVFPSGFEGFGLPALEAMRLRLPLVVSADRALAEVTGGHATVAYDLSPAPLAAAVAAALQSGEDALDAAADHAARFTWRQMAATVRASLRSV